MTINLRINQNLALFPMFAFKKERGKKERKTPTFGICSLLVSYFRNLD